MKRQKLKTLEADTQRTCIEYLLYAKIPYIRNNNFTGVITRLNGSRGFIRNTSFPGSPDLLVFLKGGVTLHIEFKSEIGKQSPDQKEYQRIAESLGHKYHIVRDLPEFTKIIINQ